MRTYQQRCALARALDVVGDRWTLLIVRELLIRGACRYTDLRAGLPGIATNLLAARLRELEESGLIVREEAPPPIATTLLRLTPRGRALERPILELGRWGAPLLAERVRGERLHAHWLVLPLRLHLVDLRPSDPACTVAILADEEALTVTVDQGSVDVRYGPCEHADLTVTGDAEAVLDLFAGRVTASAAKTARVRFRGTVELLNRIVPQTDRPQRSAKARATRGG
jgi:DNA-binding HxlR family transcriptional regulator